MVMALFERRGAPNESYELAQRAIATLAKPPVSPEGTTSPTPKMNAPQASIR